MRPSTKRREAGAIRRDGVDAAVFRRRRVDRPELMNSSEPGLFAPSAVGRRKMNSQNACTAFVEALIEDRGAAREGDRVVDLDAVIIDRQDEIAKRLDWRGLITTPAVKLLAVSRRRGSGYRVEAADALLVRLGSVNTPLLAQCSRGRPDQRGNGRQERPVAGRGDADARIVETGREGLRRTGEQLADVRRANRPGVGAAEADASIGA